MQVYFSHSYRDVEINSYFFGVLKEQNIELFADQKSPTWCVAKLERYIHELTGFLSIVPRRAAEDGSLTYSPYIGYELSLARRSRVPRLMFIDDDVLNLHRARFPIDAIPFVGSSPAADRFRHIEAISDFRKALEKPGRIERRTYRDRSVTVVSAARQAIAETAGNIMDILRTKAYLPLQVTPEQLSNALDDIEVLESILTAELCVFLLDERVTFANVLLAMAYAHCIPSIRLQYDPAAVKVEAAAETGRICWSSPNDALAAFRDQVDSYRMGFVEAISLQDVRSIGITHRTPRPEQLWDPNDGAALIRHIDLGNAHVRDVIAAVRGLKGGSLVNVDPLEICGLIYGFVRTLNFAYEHEPPTLTTGRQIIRTADDIWNDKAATCLDWACLFASLLKAAGLSPLIVIVTRPNFSHALAGYRAPGAPSLQNHSEIGDIRGSVALGDFVLFEPTGVAQHDAAVGGESAAERREGNRTLEFEIAKTAADRLIKSEVVLKYVFEVP